MDQPSNTFSNSIPPAGQDEKASVTPTPSKARSKWFKDCVAQRSLISHVASLLLATPTLALFAVDLHAYFSQPHPTPYSITHPTRYFAGNPITIIDGLAIASLAVMIIYSATYLVCVHQSIQPIAPATIQRYAVLIGIADMLLATTVISVSDTAIATRTGASNCQKLLYLDAGACSTYRCNIITAAGGIGTVASVAINIRCGTTIRMFKHRYWPSRSRRTDATQDRIEQHVGADVS